MMSEAEKINTAAIKERLINVLAGENDEQLSDKDALRLFFSIANPRQKDVDSLINDLLQKFEDLPSITNAPIEKLTKIPNLSETAAIGLKVLAACANRAAKVALTSGNESVYARWTEFTDFCRQTFAYDEIEKFTVILLDDKMHFLRYKTLSIGTVNKTIVHPREIIKAALRNSSKNLILLHNHPSGDPKPSELDIFLTRNISKLRVMPV